MRRDFQEEHLRNNRKGGSKEFCSSKLLDCVTIQSKPQAKSKRGRLSLKGESWAAPLQYVGCVPFAGTHHQTERCRCVEKRDAPREALKHDGRPVVTTTDSNRQRASLPHEEVPVSVLMAYRFNFQGRQGTAGKWKEEETWHRLLAGPA